MLQQARDGKHTVTSLELGAIVGKWGLNSETTHTEMKAASKLQSCESVTTQHYAKPPHNAKSTTPHEETSPRHRAIPREYETLDTTRKYENTTLHKNTQTKSRENL
jgi:hypothetical protein